MRMTPQNPARYPGSTDSPQPLPDSDYINAQQVAQQRQLHSRQGSMGLSSHEPPSARLLDESPYGSRAMLVGRNPMGPMGNPMQLPPPPLKKPILPPPPRTPSKPGVGPPGARGTPSGQRVYDTMNSPLNMSGSMDRRTPGERDLLMKNAPPPYSAYSGMNIISNSELNVDWRYKQDRY